MPNDMLNLVLIWAVASTMGCGSTSQSTSTSVLRPDIGAVPKELERDYEVFSHNCSKCHDIDRALTAPVTDNHHWEMYVAKMMRTPGSGIQALEAPHILRFLFWYTDRKAGRIEMGQMKASEAPVADVPAASPVETKQDTVAPAPALAPAAEPSVVQETRGEGAP